MIKGNEPAMPISREQQRTFTDSPAFGFGLTIRQQFAMNANPDIDNTPLTFMEKVLGKERPDSNDQLGIVTFIAEYKAKLQVIEADALIKELNKE